MCGKPRSIPPSVKSDSLSESLEKFVKNASFGDSPYTMESESLETWMKNLFNDCFE